MSNQTYSQLESSTRNLKWSWPFSWVGKYFKKVPNVGFEVFGIYKINKKAVLSKWYGKHIIYCAYHESVRIFHRLSQVTLEIVHCYRRHLMFGFDKEQAGFGRFVSHLQCSSELFSVNKCCICIFQCRCISSIFTLILMKWFPQRSESKSKYYSRFGEYSE